MTNRISGSIEVDHRDRNFILHTPEGQEGTTHPLVLVLHGGRSSPKMIEKISKFHTYAGKQDDFITVYPASAGKFWNDGRAVAKSDINDVKFITKLIGTLKNRYPVKEDSIFAAGMSNGGTMSVRLACECKYIRAIASVASTAVRNVIDQCQPHAAKSAMIIKGTADPISDFNGVEKPKRSIVGYHYIVQKFLSLNNCSVQPVRDTIPDNGRDYTSTRVERYTNCQDGSEVVSVIVKNGGHTWPGGPPAHRFRFLVGKTSYDFKASEMIWEFFRRHIPN
ncbi:MAG TPA: hypothetical protein VE868_00030 [Balneolaceae bacterium]|nr:hypothetical protein [Balneolaceae bacterium]